jgi:hypothetical protein
MKISNEHLKEVCKIGQGKACCRYIGLSDGWACLKHSSLKDTLDARVRSKTMTAQGDNCEGKL